MTGLLASAGITSTLLAALLAVVMGAGLVLGLSPVLSAGASATAGAQGPRMRAVPALAPVRAGTLGRRPVPPSWEYYETFGR